MKKLERPVLAEGETTGHAHQVMAEVDVFETDEQTRIFETASPCEIEHEEHGPVLIPAKEWESGQALEYDHYAEEARRVQD